MTERRRSEVPYTCLGFNTAEEDNVCECGEPEFGELGWFTTDADGEYKTFCNRCGKEQR